MDDLEVWKDIKGYEYKYEISNKGNVRIKENVTKRLNMGEIRNYIQKSKLMKPTDNGYGYLKVRLTDQNGISKNKYIHHLVANAFIDNFENKPVINHKDGVKYNNNFENLEWCTYSDNSKHCIEILKHKPNINGINDRQPVYKIDLKTGMILEKYDTITSAHKATNIYHISSVCRGLRKSAGGFSWKYCN